MNGSTGASSYESRPTVLILQLNVFLQFDYFDFWELYRFQNVKMNIVGDK
jgi:hypothetical protein